MSYSGSTSPLRTISNHTSSSASRCLCRETYRRRASFQRSDSLSLRICEMRSAGRQILLSMRAFRSGVCVGSATSGDGTGGASMSATSVIPLSIPRVPTYQKVKPVACTYTSGVVCTYTDSAKPRLLLRATPGLRYNGDSGETAVTSTLALTDQDRSSDLDDPRCLTHWSVATFAVESDTPAGPERAMACDKCIGQEMRDALVRSSFIPPVVTPVNAAAYLPWGSEVAA